MFRFYVHALRFTHLQRQTRSIIPKTDHTPKDKPVLPLPTHMRTSTHSHLFQPPRTKTLLPRASKSIRSPVDHTRNEGV